MTSLETVLARNKGIGQGFDFLRVALAISIVGFHAQLLTGNDWVRTTPLWFLEYCLVPMFFALSGFLVTASGLRLSLKNFLINRGLRILPALAVDVVVCALLIGPLITTCALSDYFADRRFISYFFNVTGYIHYELPGVFENHINTRVNGALWTVPYEMMCYVITSFFIIAKLLRSPSMVATFTGIMIGAGIIFEHHSILDPLPWVLRRLIFFALISRDAQIVTAFLFGVLAFQLRSRIPYSKALFALCMVICLGATLRFDGSLIEAVGPRIILLPALAYITVFIGLTPIRIPGYFKKGDYSYGIYLYHDPFLQLVISAFPAMAMMRYVGGAFAFFVGLPFVFLVANISWHRVEKPILALRKKFSFIAKARGVEDLHKLESSPVAAVLPVPVSTPPG